MPLRHASMLEVNEYLVLDFVRECGSTSRPEIGRSLDLSAATVSRIVGRLLKAGLVVEERGSSSDGGRPPGVIVFNPRAGAVIAVDLAAASCHGALADLAGDLLYENVCPTGELGSAFETLVSVIDALAAQAVAQDVPVAALAVGVPAIVDPETGIGLAGPSVAWESFDLVASLRARVTIPFVVENDVNLAALAHAWRGDGLHASDFFTLHLGAGVGGAVVANGRLVKGSHNGGGEIGYLLVNRAQSRRPLDGTVGGLEAVVAEGALVARAWALAGSRGLAWATPAGPTGISELVAASRAADPIALQVMNELVDHVAMALVGVGAVIDPALVILDGSVGRALEPWVPTLAAALARRLPRAPRLVVSRLRGEATLLGAVAAALELARRRSAPSALFGIFSTSGGAHGMS